MPQNQGNSRSYLRDRKKETMYGNPLIVLHTHSSITRTLLCLCALTRRAKLILKSGSTFPLPSTPPISCFVWSCHYPCKQFLSQLLLDKDHFFYILCPSLHLSSNAKLFKLISPRIFKGNEQINTKTKYIF